MARKLKEYPSVTLRLEDLNGEINLVQVIGRSGPLHVEIGTGKATFLINQAKAQPNINFLGIERANKYYRFAVDRIGRWKLNNVKLIRTDAAVFLAEFLPAESVDCFHIYFPDPWPKRRHYKRRFLCPANLEHLVRCLKTGGTLRIATDHAEYFEEIQRLITDKKDSSQGRLEQIEFLPVSGAMEGELTGTNYERKYIKDKRQIYTIAAVKK
ncbi:MAG: tRNA (guanosine(46)-N7)-methyltransferase TrmB [Planctomycetes bacterium RBG_13_46_10]|nr:MAG: tRNA (guanosine(46)-N7)-methyltransferase TrmB [Planctomycetes bacterium RBG_13_46_10]